MSLFPKESGVKTTLKESFIKWNVQAMLATGTDWTVFYLLNSKLDVQYQLAVIIAASCGALLAFLLGRNWTYKNTEAPITGQSAKFVIVALGSIFLNYLGVTLFVELGWLPKPLYAKMLTSFIVGLVFNFPMQRFFAFR